MYRFPLRARSLCLETARNFSTSLSLSILLSLSLVYTLLTGDSLVKAFIRAREIGGERANQGLRAVFIHNYLPASCSSNAGIIAAFNYIERWRAVNVLPRGISRNNSSRRVGAMRIELDISFRRIRKREGKGRNEAARMRTLSTRSRFIPDNVFYTPPIYFVATRCYNSPHPCVKL